MPAALQSGRHLAKGTVQDRNQVQEFAGQCSLKEHTVDKVHIILRPEQEHLLKTAQNKRLQEAIHTRFGDNVKLVITVENISEETPAEQRTREEKEKQAAAVQSFENDVNVKSIVETFGGTIDKDTIVPQ